jgi:hypothetical protein
VVVRQADRHNKVFSRMAHASTVSIVNSDHNRWAIFPGSFVSVTIL